MKAFTKETWLIVVMGDVHARLELALRGLTHLEQELGRGIDQVFSVGDLGLFLLEEEWQGLTAPSKHRHPEWTPRLRAAWHRWPWPLAVIGGNHEPYLRMRVFGPGYFGDKLTYVDAGVLAHTVPELRVYGLSGIYHPDDLEYSRNKDLPVLKGGRLTSWAEVADAVRRGQQVINPGWVLPLEWNLKKRQ